MTRPLYIFDLDGTLSNADHTPDDKLKKRWLDEMHWDDRSRIVAVFEDRARVVAMWRAAGIPCFQVADGDF